MPACSVIHGVQALAALDTAGASGGGPVSACTLRPSKKALSRESLLSRFPDMLTRNGADFTGATTAKGSRGCPGGST